MHLTPPPPNFSIVGISHVIIFPIFSSVFIWYLVKELIAVSLITIWTLSFDFKKIIKLYYFKSKRWDIETSEGYLIKLSRNDVKKDLNLFVRLSNEDKFKNELVIDFRQKDQIILNGK